MKLDWNFLGGWGMQNEKPSLGGVRIFFLELHNVSNMGESVSDFQTPRSW